MAGCQQGPQSHRNQEAGLRWWGGGAADTPWLMSVALPAQHGVWSRGWVLAPLHFSLPICNLKLIIAVTILSLFAIEFPFVSYI